MSRLRRRAAVLGLLATGGLIAAACSSSPANTPNSRTTTTTTAAASTTTTSSVATTSSTTTSTTATAVGCQGVTATPGQGQGAAGTITGTVTLSVSGSSSCSLLGYPTMSLFSSSGSPIPVTMVDGLSVNISSAANGPPATVNLSPNQKVQFTYQYSDVPVGSETTCPSSASATVTPPGATAATPRFTLALNPCDSGTIRVSPVYAAS